MVSQCARGFWKAGFVFAVAIAAGPAVADGPESATELLATSQPSKPKQKRARKVSAERPSAVAAGKDATTQPRDGSKDERLAAEESLARFQQILAKRPLHGPAFVGLVKHFSEQGRLDDLVKEYEQKVKALPDQPALKIVLARIYARTGRSPKAAAIIDAIERTPSGTPDDESKLLIFKSEVYQQTGRNDAAREMLEKAMKQARTVSERLKLAEALADLHIRVNDPKQAAAVLRKLGGEFPDNYLHRKRISDALAQRDLHEDAIQEYQDLLKLAGRQTDQRVEVLRQLGRSLERLEKRQEAIAAYSEALGLLSAGHWLQKELHERIVALYRALGRLEDLLKYCRRELERAPDQTSLRSLLADVQAATGDVEGAKKTLAEAARLFPKDRGLSDNRIQFLDRLHDAPGIAEEYERIIAQLPDDVELYIGYGQFLASNKQLEAARNQWKHVLNRDVTDAGLAQRLGALFEPYELHDDAIECYERAIKLAPRRPEGYLALSRLWLFRGQKERAAEAMRRLAKANPDDAATLATLCQSFMNLGLTDEALAAITRACELDEKQVNYRLARADALVASGQASEALKVRRDALDLINNPGQLISAMDVLVSMYASSNKLSSLREAEELKLTQNPRSTLSLLLLARVADFDRQFVESRKWLNQLLEIEPANEEGLRQLAKLYEAVGDLDAATESYRKLSELYPARARQYFQAVADLKLRYSDRSGAIEFFEKMVQSAPGNATVLKSVAEQLLRLEEFERAIALYEESLKLQPDFAEVRLALGKALEDSGRLDEALTAFKAAALQRKDRDTAIDAMGRLYETAGQIGKLDELLNDLHTRVESNPDDTLTAQMLAELLVREYEYARANEMLDLVLRQHPRDAELQLVRADILRRLARFDESIEGYRSVLRLPNVDRDYVLGELGKAQFEAGKLDAAKTSWRQINHKIYAGSLLRNNGLLDDAIETLREGIRLKPDDFGLHRNLIATLQAAGKTDDALEAARHLLDLEPDNVFNIEAVAKAFLDRGDRAAAAEVAARLFSAGVVEKKEGGGGKGGFQGGGMPVWAMSMQAAWGGFGQGTARSNLDRAVQFFQENGLLAELEETLTRQMKLQPNNALLRQRAAQLFTEAFGKPETALALYKELETSTFPLEYQDWLGQCSQRDFMRVAQYRLIGSKPGLRDKRLAELEALGRDKLDRDTTLELAVIRQSQGANDEAIELLKRVTDADSGDFVAQSVLVETLIRAERFKDAERPVKALAENLGNQRDKMRSEMVERVRRDFVRTLPMQFQMRVTDELLGDIADKWTLGQALVGDFTGFAQVMGYFRAQLSLGTVYAKTDRMDLARDVWKSLEPKHAADADGWTMLAGVAQLHEQNDLAYRYYEKALEGAKRLAEDPLLQRIYSSTLSSGWYGGAEGAVDSAFNKIVEAFAGQQKLIQLYDFLRETDQTAKARRVAEQYQLYDELKREYTERFEKARETFRATNENMLQRSVPYLVATCKLAELYDQTGDWPGGLKVYEQYLTDYPDELGLLLTLGEAAEAQEDYAGAIAWEKKALDAKERLSRRSREWMLRQLPMTPAPPQVCRQARNDMWSWQRRWGKGYWWGYGSQSSPLEVWPSWMRVAQLNLSFDNPIAAADAMERAVGSAGADREQVAAQLLATIQQRQLTAKMLPVLRSLAVNLPTNEKVQLAFAESLEANRKADVAAEVYRRMMRRGVSDIGSLARVRDKLKSLQPKAVDEIVDTLEGLEAAVRNDGSNANSRLRLAKAYYYSLRLDDALTALAEVQKTAPHLEGLHELLIEIYTLRGDTDAVIEALRARIKRSKDDVQKRQARWRLVEELLAAGRDDDALKELKDAVDPKDPSTYQRVGLLLHYFGQHDEAVKQFELSGRSQRQNAWDNEDDSKVAIARAMVLKGDIPAAAQRILDAVEANARKATQFSGLSGMYAMYDMDRGNPFDSFIPLFVLRPELLEAVQAKIVKDYEAKPDDPQIARKLMQLYQRTGRPDLADGILEKMTDKGISDQNLVTRLIDRAVERRQYDLAVSLATKWIEQQPKPSLPPGIPAQYAGMMVLMSPRNLMICKLGDIYWKMGQQDKAFESYKRIVDDKVDESRLAYAAICSLRGRQEEALKLVDEALTKQKVKSPSLLQFRAMLAAADNEPERVFELLADAAEIGAGQQANPFSYSEDGRNDPNALVAIVAARAGLLDRYAEFLKKQIGKNPNEWSNHLALAKLHYDRGRTDEAFRVLDAADKVKSLKREVLQQRVAWLEGMAPPAELVPLYEQLVQASERKVKAPTNSGMAFFTGSSPEPRAVDSQPLRERLGDLLWQQGKQEPAVKAWTARMNLESAPSQIQLAQRLLDRDAIDKAEAAYRKAVELEPRSVDAHQALAELAVEQKDAPGAREHLKEAFLRRLEQPKDAERSGSMSYDMNMQRQRAPDEQLRSVAFRLIRDATSTSPPPTTAPADDDVSLALAILLGDWNAAEELLTSRLKSAPFDPAIWRLWAQLQERKGEWSEAAKAWESVRRIERTTIGSHRDQLKLVLAGKHIKEAAAGSKQATQQPSMAGMPRNVRQYSGSYGRYYWGSQFSSDDSRNRLADLYVKTGQYDKAERLYLLSSEGDVGSTLPYIAGVMWRQGAKKRAGEIAVLAVMLSNDASQLQDYAGLLAESGAGEQAVDLLVRQYRCAAPRENRGAFSGISRLYNYQSNDDEFTDWEERNLVQTLCSIARRQGSFDEILKRLSAQVAENPGDARLGRLVLNMQIQDGKWEEARATLNAERKQHPEDMSYARQLLRANQQLGDWDNALAVLEDLRKAEPERMDDWRLNEAFVRLMKGDADAAVRAVEPMLTRLPTESADRNRSQRLATVLAAARAYDRLVTYLEFLAKRNAIDANGRAMLARIYREKGRLPDAATTLLEEFWKQPSALSTNSPSFRELAAVVAGAAASGNAIESPDMKPEDAAIFSLIRGGPTTGIEAFEKVVSEQPDNLSARRGLVLACTLAGKSERAVTANRELIDWLTPRRTQVWYEPPRLPIGESAAAFLDDLRARDIDGQAVLGMSMSFSELLKRMLGVEALYMNRSVDPIVRYEQLWLAHEQMQDDLLAAARQTDALGELLKTQSELGAGLARRTDGGRATSGRSYTVSNVGGTVTYYYDEGDGYSSGQSTFDSNWRDALRQRLRQYRLFEALESQLQQLGPKLVRQDAGAISELYATLGRADDARQWRDRQIDELWTRMSADDQPSASANTDRYGWWWRPFRSFSDEQLPQVRNAIRSCVRRNPDPTGDSKRPYDGAADELWELALIDDGAASKLNSLAASVGPGWENTNTFRQLVALYRATKRYSDILVLTDKVLDRDRLLASNQLGGYLEACVEAGDWERFNAVLNALAERSGSLAIDVRLMRLMALRHQGKNDEADKLEKSLIEACYDEQTNPVALETWVVGDSGTADSTWQQTYGVGVSASWTNYYPGYSMSRSAGGLETIPAFANALGVGIRPGRRPEDISLGDISSMYAAHGLMSDAARIVQMQIDKKSGSAISPRAKANLQMQRVAYLGLAGQSADAKALLTEVEAFWKSEAAARPNDPTPWFRLETLYTQEAAGPDRKKALESRQEARNRQLKDAEVTLTDADYLYRLGRYEEAWKAYRELERRGQLSDRAGRAVQAYSRFQQSTPAAGVRNRDLFQAGLAARRAGDEAAAKSLLRQAEWRDPNHPLAKEAKEMSYE